MFDVFLPSMVGSPIASQLDSARRVSGHLTGSDLTH